MVKKSNKSYISKLGAKGWSASLVGMVRKRRPPKGESSQQSRCDKGRNGEDGQLLQQRQSQPTLPNNSVAKKRKIKRTREETLAHHHQIDNGPKQRRRNKMASRAGREYQAAERDSVCQRCALTADEHFHLKRGKLEKHHVVALHEGGHVSDPANLYTLCHFCHREWHTYWEGNGNRPESEWPEYMAATPYRVAVAHAQPQEDLLLLQRDDCQRCGISATRCEELRPGRVTTRPFEPGWRKRDVRDVRKMSVCYWCQREWEIFWRSFRPNVSLFHRAKPFRPLALTVPRS